MPRPARTHCRQCEGHTDDVGALSRRGLCPSCGLGNAAEAARQLAEHRGPYFDRWRANMGAAVGARDQRG